jgi:hypothetical protein
VVISIYATISDRAVGTNWLALDVPANFANLAGERALTPPAPPWGFPGRAGVQSSRWRDTRQLLHEGQTPPLRGHQAGLTSHLAACNGWASRGTPHPHTKRKPRPVLNSSCAWPRQTGWAGKKAVWTCVWSARWLGSAGGRRAIKQAPHLHKYLI